jgi:hypothetical protein
VYDRHSYPLVHSEGEVALVFPQAVKMVIEVKTRLNKGTLQLALENIRAAKQFDHSMCGVVFAFNSQREETIIKHLRQYPQPLPMEHAPTAILLFNRGVIIHCWHAMQTKEHYEVRASKDKDSATVLAFLLLLFFDAQMEGVWGGANIVNMNLRMLEHKTEQIADDFQIGDTF